ncbi:hypothetical protein [Streptomyces sp. RerS4]|uniref:hypothetical protein n=1 Tax=Streptomyces sp. RerS4 TaxID=2942449 RepID=UPI00201C73F7|nr:hypothetical protein [Streptomyces sp. RerS4]UQX03710.1 hypothetical protein M4D82_26870 [Streptomyces sp. RerS4]
MADAVPVRCPACLRENGYTAPVFPCACGSPVAPPLDLAAPPLPLTHRTWSESWVAVRCGACGRESEWPHPEVGCGSCGTVVRIPVLPPQPAEPGGPAGPGGSAAGAGKAGDARGGVRGDVGDGVRPKGDAPGRGPAPAPGEPDPRSGARAPHALGSAPAPAPGSSGGARTPIPRPAFRPVTIRTARDAVVTAALYLRWLGFQDVRQPDGLPIPSAAVDLRAPGVVAQVDPTTAPAGLRAVECVWLNGLTASATSVYFSLAGYTEEARGRADELGIPLFVMDLTGMPQPVNDPADILVSAGA